ncbi:MAG: VOC family protein [Gemmatimonadaceae bacterium]|nr:VOC family protein [Gemmatimonadaceae bacterium]
MTASSPAAAEQELHLDRIGQVAIVVQDTARAVRFYRDVLGMRLLFEAPPSLAFFDCGGVRLMLTPHEGRGDAAPSSILYYRVNDLDAAHATLLARGVRVERAPHLVAALPDHDLRMAFLRDSEGNVLGLMSEVPRGRSA